MHSLEMIFGFASWMTANVKKATGPGCAGSLFLFMAPYLYVLDAYRSIQ